MKRIVLLLLIFCCASCSAQAISFTFSDKSWDYQINGLLPEKWHSLDRVKLYETTFDDIEKFYGEGVRIRKEEKEGSPFFLCYSLQDKYVVVFESGPLGGWSIVTGILIAEKQMYDDKSCGGNIDLKASFGIGDLSIGDEDERIYELLGQPSFKAKEGIAYRYEHKGGSKISDNQAVDVTSGIEVGINKGRVNWIKVYWLEST